MIREPFANDLAHMFDEWTVPLKVAERDQMLVPFSSVWSPFLSKFAPFLIHSARFFESISSLFESNKGSRKTKILVV